MTIPVKYPVALSATFLWIGFVCAISFLEAWLKFTAPGVTLPIGLGIGRLVFSALNKVEWVLAISIASNIVFSRGNLISARYLFYFIPLLLLIVQTIWFLPALDVRAEMYIQGAEVPSSTLHIYYVGAEVIKLICLFLLGIQLFKIHTYEH